MTRKQRSIFFRTFWIVFVLSVLVTLFQPPTYEAVASVPLGKPLSVPTRRRLKEDGWLVAVRESVPAPEYTDSTEIFIEGTADMPRADVIVDSGDPKYCAALADAVAGRLREDAKRMSGSDLPPVEPAKVPEHPIRPKKLQNITFGAIVGAVLGLILAVIFRGASKEQTLTESKGN